MALNQSGDGTYTVNCDNPHNNNCTRSLNLGWVKNYTEARQEAFSRGWTQRSHNGQWACRECRKGQIDHEEKRVWQHI